jgi:hypothetical protein
MSGVIVPPPPEAVGEASPTTSSRTWAQLTLEGHIRPSIRLATEDVKTFIIQVTQFCVATCHPCAVLEAVPAAHIQGECIMLTTDIHAPGLYETMNICGGEGVYRSSHA